MQGCGISSLKYYETPLGNIEIDTECFNYKNILLFLFKF